MNVYVWNLEKWYKLYLQRRNRYIDAEKKTYGHQKGKRGGGGRNWETGIDIYTLLLLLSHVSRVRFCATP